MNIEKLSMYNPAKPLKGRGNARVRWPWERRGLPSLVLGTIPPQHKTSVWDERRSGGYISRHDYVSPEAWASTEVKELRGEIKSR